MIPGITSELSFHFGSRVLGTKKEKPPNFGFSGACYSVLSAGDGHYDTEGRLPSPLSSTLTLSLTFSLLHS